MSRPSSLEVLMGPMFAGKSSAIQSIVRRHQALGRRVFVVTHTIDTRYTTEPTITNHDGQVLPAIATSSLMKLLGHVAYGSSDLVVIDEAQFFEDLIPFALQVVEIDKKDCVVVGLDGDSERRPFGHLLELLPLCDRVQKLTGFCKRCGDGTPGLFSFAHTSNSSIVHVGGAEAYSTLCRTHYLESKGGTPSTK